MNGGAQRLGRGLGALLGEHADRAPADEVRNLPVKAVRANPQQPRRTFTSSEIEELAASIRANGLLQPILVRPTPGTRDQWQLIAGERRLRAVTLLEWAEVPTIVRDVDDRGMVVLALVENLQRQDLGVLEEAQGYRNLIDNHSLTQEKIARAVGKNRATVANTLRLLKLPAEVQKLLRQRKLTAGHARALLPVADARQAAQIAGRAIREGWTVRTLERYIRENPVSPPPANPDEPSPVSAGDSAVRGGSPSASTRRRKDSFVRTLQDDFRAALGARVVVKMDRRGKGRIEIAFRDRRDIERLLALVSERSAAGA